MTPADTKRFRELVEAYDAFMSSPEGVTLEDALDVEDTLYRWIVTQRHALLALAEASEWRPIDQCPDSWWDGRRLIGVWAHNPEPVICWFDKHKRSKSGWIVSHCTAYKVGMDTTPKMLRPLPPPPGDDQ